MASLFDRVKESLGFGDKPFIGGEEQRQYEADKNKQSGVDKLRSASSRRKKRRRKRRERAARLERERLAREAAASGRHGHVCHGREASRDGLRSGQTGASFR